MGKIALLVAREEMLHLAHNILQEKDYGISEIRVIKTEDAVSEARHSIAEGAQVIIARGLQASLIKQYTDALVVDMVVTAQEMALLVLRAKQILAKQPLEKQSLAKRSLEQQILAKPPLEPQFLAKSPLARPVIGVVGFEDMFCDMSYFDTIYNIELRTYFVKWGSELGEAADRAVADGVDLVIGGDTAVGAASGAGVPSLFLSITEDSMRGAFAMAVQMQEALGAKMRGVAQMEALLDHSFSGIIRMNGDGIVVDINPVMADLLGQDKEAVLGLTAGAACPGLDQEGLRQVLEERLESCSFFMESRQAAIFATVAPVMVAGRVDGAILICHRVRKPAVGREPQKQRHSQGLVAPRRFEDIVQHSKAMRDCLHFAKLCALSDKPVFIFGEAGTEKRLLAQGIHNAGLREGGPFVEVSCEGIVDAGQTEMLFGEKGAVARAEGGTLMVESLGAMSKANQGRLCQLIRYHLRAYKGVGPHPQADVRVMISESVPLSALQQGGLLRDELFYLLQGLAFRIPPLRERREDLEWKLDDSLRDCCGHYSRYHSLTAGARAYLLEFAWPGNLLQVETYCERLILTAKKRSLDEVYAQEVMEELMFVAPLPPDQSEEAEQIRAALQKYSGSREKTAAALGISKATLWRKMKRYRIG